MELKRVKELLEAALVLLQQSEAKEERRKEPKLDYGDVTNQEQHPAICSICGNNCMLPFKPKNKNPVYCKECYKTRMGY